MLEELPGAIDNVKILPEKCSKNTTEGWYNEVKKHIIFSYGNKNYYRRIKKSIVSKSYYICLYCRNLDVHPIVETDFQLTIPAAREQSAVFKSLCLPPIIVKNFVWLKNIK